MAVVTVDNPVDVRDAADGLTSLSEAIAATNDMVGPDTIVFSPSVFGEMTMTTNIEPIGDTLTIAGPGPQHLSLVDLPHGFSIFEGSTPVDVNIVGLSFEPYGRESEPIYGIFNSFSSGTITLEDVNIVGRILEGIQARGNVVLRDTQIINTYDDILRRKEGVVTTGDVTLIRSTVSNFGEGGIYARGNVSITDSTVTNNLAENGGGIWSDGAVSVTNSVVSGNTAFGQGGGIRALYDVTIADSIIADNSAYTEVGGGIWSDGAVYITYSMVSGNSATHNLHGRGGGIRAQYEVTLTNSSVTANTSLRSGGASIQKMVRRPSAGLRSLIM